MTSNPPPTDRERLMQMSRHVRLVGSLKRQDQLWLVSKLERAYTLLDLLADGIYHVPGCKGFTCGCPSVAAAAYITGQPCP